MNTELEMTSTKAERLVQFWAVLGPLLSIITIMVSTMYNTHGQWALTVTALCCLPVCMQWRLKGAVGAMSLLALIFLNNVFELNADQTFWQGGLAAAFALTGIVTALAYDEMGEVLESIQIESKSRLKTLVSLDQKLNDARIALERDKAQAKKDFAINGDAITALTEQVKQLEEERSQLQSAVQEKEHVLEQVQDKLNESAGSQDMLLQEIARLEEALQGKIDHLEQLSRQTSEQKEKLHNKDLEFASLNDLINSLEKQCLELTETNEILQLEKQQTASGEEIGRYQAQIRQLEQASAEAFARAEEEKKINVSLQERNTYLEAAQQELSTANQQFSEQLLHHQQTIAQLQERELALTKLVEAEKNNEETARYQAQIQQLEQASMDAADRIEEEKKINASLQERISYLEAAQQDLSLAKQQFGEQLLHQQQTIAQFEERELTLTKLIEAEQNKGDKLVLELKEREEGLMKLTGELEAERQRSEQLASALETRQEQPQEEGEETKKSTRAKSKEATEVRRLKGLHKQLQQQFEEKCEVLDEARRAQFRMQERLLNLQREAEENKRKEKGEFEALLEEHIARAETERQQMIEEHQKEIENLHEVISTLTAKSEELQSV